MIESRQKIFNQIVEGINLSENEINCKKIFLVTGDFGIGKSYIIDQVENDLNNNCSSDVVLRLQQENEMGNLPEFLNNAILSFKACCSESGRFRGSETAYNMTRYLELLNLIKSKNPELFEEALEAFVLKSDADIFTSGKFTENESIRESITQEISQLIAQKGDRRLLLETPKVAAESFIVDLMTFCFDTEQQPNALKDAINQKKKKKVVFIIDNYEHISGSINQWLNDEFFDYCYNKTFGDFIAYGISHIPSALKISDIFDFRFIISSRKDHIATRPCHLWERYLNQIVTFNMPNIELSELPEFIREAGYLYEDKLENLLDISFGIPFVLLLWLEFYTLEDVEEDNSIIYSRTSEEILKYCSEDQKTWLKCASFLNEFDENGIRCFPEIGDNYLKAFEFLKSATDFTVKSPNNNKLIEIKTVIREFLKETNSILSFQTAKEYSSISRNYNEIKDVFTSLSSDEVNVVRNLAYFHYIDDNYGVEQTFQNDTEKARSFIKKYSGWFEKHNRSLMLKPDLTAKLIKYNHMIDKEKFIDKQNLIGKIWENQQKRLKSEILDCQASLPDLNQEIQLLEKENNNNKAIYEGYQKEFIEKENQLIELRKQLDSYSSRHSFISSGINFLAAIILVLISVFFPHFFGSPENQDSVEIVQYILRFLSIIFGIIGFVYSIKGGMIISKKKEINQVKDRISTAETEKQEQQEKLRVIREGRESSQRRIIEIYDKLKEINNKIKENEEKLLDPYLN